MKKLRQKKDIQIEKLKIIFQFVIMIICSTIIGICLIVFAHGNIFDAFLLKVTDHFGYNLFDNFEWTDIQHIFRICLPDFLVALSILAFSFSFINYVLTDIALVFCGIRFGINVSLMFIFAHNIGISLAIAYAVFKTIILIVLWWYSYIMAIYSLDIRRFSNIGRFKINARAVFNMFLVALSIIALILILNIVFCVLIYIIK